MAPTTTLTGGSGAGNFFALYGNGSYSWAVNNKGTLNGATNGAGFLTSSTLANVGTISGGTNEGLYLAAGGSIYNGNTTHLSALIHGGGPAGIYSKNSATTITNYGSITGGTNGVWLNNGGTVTNSGTISASTVGVRSQGSALALSNSGTITATGGTGTGVYLNGGGTISNTGLLSGANLGIDSRNSAATISNLGTINGGAERGVYLLAGGVVTNGDSTHTAALIHGGGGPAAIYARVSSGITNWGSITGGSNGVFLTNGGTVTNSGTASYIGGSSRGVLINGTAGTVTNAGTIKGGIYLGPGGTVINTGAIQGAIGVQSSFGATVVTNQGTITGTSGAALLLNGTAANTVANYGALIGNAGTSVAFGSGNDRLLIGPNGSFTGVADGGGGGNTLEFVTGTNSTFSNFTNFGTIVIDSGASWSNSGSTNLVIQNSGTLNNTGTVTHGIVVSGSGVLNNSSVIQATYGGAVYVSAGGSVINSGTGSRIIGSTYGVKLHAGGSVNNQGSISGGFFSAGVYTNGGTVVNGGSANTSATIYGANKGVYGKTTLVNVTNFGTINSGTAAGVGLVAGGNIINSGSASLIKGASSGAYITTAAGSVTNAGTITDTNVNDTAGVYLNHGGLVTNSANALISGHRRGVYANSFAATIVNSGSIIATNTGTSFYKQAGVLLAAGGSVTNSGSASLISGYYGIQGRAGVTIISNQGTIKGNSNAGIFLVNSTAANTIANYGAIIGSGGNNSVAFGSGNDLLQIGPNGTFTGLADGGTGTNTIEFLSGDNSTFNNFAHFGIIQIDAGAAWSNSAFLNLTVTDAGTFSNSGTVINTVTVSGSGVVSNSSIGAIQGPTGVKGTGASVNITNSGTVRGTATSGANGGVFFTNGGTVSNSGASSYIFGHYGVLITGAAGTVSNAGTIQGNYGGVALESGGSISNSNRISAYYTGIIGYNTSIAVSNIGTVISTGGNFTAVYLYAGGSVSNGDSSHTAALIQGGNGIQMAGAAGSVSNFGTIKSTNGYGVYLRASGSVTNGDSSHTGALIQAYDNGIVMAGPTGSGTVSNFGTIKSANGVGVYLYNGGVVTNSGSSSYIGGGGQGVHIKGGAGTIINAGTIIDGILGGIFLDNGGSIANSGSASLIKGAKGITAAGAASVITNSGTIVATGTNTPGIVFSGTFNNTVTNGGTIIGNGGTAVAFGSGNDKLILQAGYKFTGVVDGSTGTNTLEINTGSAKFTNVGVAFLNFGAIQVDSGGTLDLTGVTTLPASLPLTNAGTVSNPGPLTIPGSFTNTGVFANTGTVTVTGTFTNSGSFNNTGLITGNAAGILGGGTVNNSGTIIGNGGAGVNLTTTGTVINSGLIQGSTYGSMSGAGGTVINTGTIKDPGIAGALIETSGVLVNQTSGLITGTIGVLFNGTSGTLTNNGTITGTAGVAIQLGAGSNSVTLGTGSVLSGTIDGGTGAGQIALTGTGSMSNTISNFGTGSALSVASGASWTASGAWTVATVTNSGTLQPGTAGSPLKLTGKFVQASTGVLNVALKSDGTGSQLQVTGAATLAGTVAVTPSGTFASGATKFAVVTASGGVTGTFASVSGGTALLTASLSYDANDAFVTMTQQNVATTTTPPATTTTTTPAAPVQANINSFTETQNEFAVASAFDIGRAANASAFQPALTALDTQNAAGVTGSLDKLSGENNAGLATAGLIAGRQFLNVVQTHNLQTAGADPEWGIWASGFAQNGSLAGNANTHRLSQTVSGAAGGVDYWTSPNLRIGVAFGFGAGHFRVGGGLGSGHVSYTEIAANAGYSEGPLYLTGVLGGAIGSGSTSRDVSLPGLAATASGHNSSSQMLGAGEAGYKILEGQGISLTPFAAINLTSQDQDAFTETGAGTMNLSVAAKSSSSSQGILGAHVGLDLGSSISADLKAGWAHEFNTRRTISQSFAGIAGTGFTVAGASLPGDSMALGADIQVKLGEGSNAFVHYDGALGAGSSTQAFSMGLRFAW